MPALVALFKAGTSAQPTAIASLRSPLRDVVARTDLSRRGQRADTELRSTGIGSGRRDERERIAGQLFADHRTQHAVGRRVADQNPTEQGLGVVGEHQLGVRLVDGVVDHHLEATGVARHGVAEAGDVDAEQLQLGRRVGLAELGCAAEQSVCHDLGAGVARTDQAVAAAVDGGDLADRVDVGIRGEHRSGR